MMNSIQFPYPMIPIAYEPKEINALLISDSHVHGGNLNNLLEWLKAAQPNYDVVFLLGNMANVTNKLRNDYFAETEGARQLADTVAFLHDYINKPVFYIPGNTEPTGSYNCMLEVPGAMNLHKRAVQLDEGLVIIGLGGAIPAKKEDKDVLEGYPYTNEEEFTKDLSTCIETATKTFESNTNFLLLTHIGPKESATSEVHIGADKIDAGYKGVSELIKDKNIIGHIHGHSAHAEGMTKPFGSSIPVINPGGLVAGRFAEISLRRNIHGNWKIADVQFRSLD